MVAGAASGEPRHSDWCRLWRGRRRCRRAWRQRSHRVRSRGTFGDAPGAVGDSEHADRWQAPVLPGRPGAGAAVVAGGSSWHRLPGRRRLHHRASLTAHHRRSPQPYRVETVAPGLVESLAAQRLRDFLDPRTKFAPAPAPPGGSPLDVARLAAQVARNPEGERNLGLFKAACRMAEHGHPPGEALDALGPAATQSGLGEREIVRTVGSAYRHVSTYGPRRRAPVRQTDAGFGRAALPVAVSASGRGL